MTDRSYGSRVQIKVISKAAFVSMKMEARAAFFLLGVVGSETDRAVRRVNRETTAKHLIIKRQPIDGEKPLVVLKAQAVFIFVT